MKLRRSGSRPALNDDPERKLPRIEERELEAAGGRAERASADWTVERWTALHEPTVLFEGFAKGERQPISEASCGNGRHAGRHDEMAADCRRCPRRPTRRHAQKGAYR